jgi:hypothetical protein
MQRHRNPKQRPQNFRLNRNHNLAQGLVFGGLGRYFNSTYYHDSSLYGNHGTLTNMDPPTAWVFDPFLGRWVNAMTASGNYIAFGDDATAPAAVSCERISVGVWCKRTNYADGFDGGVARGRAMDAYSGLSWELTWLNSLAYFGASNEANTVKKSGNASITDNNWHHYLGSYDGAYLRIFKDGVAATPTAFTDAIDYVKTYNYFRIGYAYTGTTYCLNGYLADVCIWNRALSSAEIQQLADPSDTMLGGLLQYPTRKWWPVAIAAALGGNFPIFRSRIIKGNN